MSKKKLTPEKKNVILNLLEAYDIKTTADLQDALKDLLGSTIQEMLEAELDEELGYAKGERTEFAIVWYLNAQRAYV